MNLQLGDWVTRTTKHEPFTARVTSLRDPQIFSQGFEQVFTCSEGDSYLWPWKDHQPATDEEIAAVPIKEGDWVQYRSGLERRAEKDTAFQVRPRHLGNVDLVHAIPAVWRKAMGRKTDTVVHKFEIGDWAIDTHGGHRRTPTRVTAAHAGIFSNEGGWWVPATDEEIADKPVKKGDLVVGTESCSLTRNTHSGPHEAGSVEYGECSSRPVCRHATPDEYREHHQTDVVYTNEGPTETIVVQFADKEVKVSDDVIGGELFGFETVRSDWATGGVNATAVKTDDVPDNWQSHKSGSDMESSDVEGVTLDPEKVEAQFAAQSNNIAAINSCIGYLQDDVKRLKESPPQPEVEDPFLYQLFTGERHLILEPSKNGGVSALMRSQKSNKAVSLYLSQFTKDKRQCVKPTETLDSVRERAEDEKRASHLEGFNKGKADALRKVDWERVLCAAALACIPGSILLGAYLGWMGL